MSARLNQAVPFLPGDLIRWRKRETFYKREVCLVAKTTNVARIKSSIALQAVGLKTGRVWSLDESTLMKFEYLPDCRLEVVTQ